MNNPYQTPESDIRKSSSSQQANPSPFSKDGRFSRLSYIAWITIVGFVAQALIAIIMSIMGIASSPVGLGVLNVLVQIPALICHVIFTMRRTHDFGKSRWWVALYLLPLVNFYIWFKAGDETNNEFGAPRPTTTVEKVIAYFSIAFISLAIIGLVIAAVVYKGYFGL
jgi:uncharacterized membrane protein YhaH (DUF805 family)